MNRRAAVLIAAVSVLLAVGAPAAADPAGPTHFRSTVTEIVTEDGGAPDAEVEILGGDAFLVVRAAPGSEVQVPGYEGEPYVRIAADGTVEVNTRSPARWLNDARFGEAEVEVPPIADVDAPPEWEPVARGGEYAWHDHRIHFMSPALPSSVDPAADEPQEVLEWEVPLVVDGREVVARGALSWIPGPSPAIPIGAVLLSMAAGVALALRWPSTLPAVIAAGALLTGAVGVAASLGLPTGVEGEPALVLLPVLALAGLGGAHAWSRRDPARGPWMIPAAGLPVAVWAVLQLGALTRPIVPGSVPAGLVRGVTALGLGVAAAAGVAIVRRLLEVTALDPADRD